MLCISTLALKFVPDSPGGCICNASVGLHLSKLSVFTSSLEVD